MRRVGFGRAFPDLATIRKCRTSPLSKLVFHQMGVGERSQSLMGSEAEVHQEVEKSTAPDTVTVQTPFKRLLSAYHTSLTEHPLATKAVTSASIAALGDILASWRGGKGNLRRTLAFFLFGGCITAPLLHWWYGLLERVCNRMRLSGNKSAAAKVLLDRLVYTPPFLALTLVTLRLLESGRLGRSVGEARKIYLGTLLTNYKVWTPAQAINFTFVPPAYRVLFGNCVALWWSYYLSVSNRGR